MFVMGFRIGVVTIRSTLRGADKVPVVYSNRIAMLREQLSTWTGRDNEIIELITSFELVTRTATRVLSGCPWTAVSIHIASRLLLLPIIYYLDKVRFRILAVSYFQFGITIQSDSSTSPECYSR